MAEPTPACPAAEIVHPINSLNANDVRCHVVGHMRPEQGSPCTNPDGYVRCSAWRTQRDLEQAGKGTLAQSTRSYKHADLSREKDLVRT